jgi:hypothetical protein
MIRAYFFNDMPLVVDGGYLKLKNYYGVYYLSLSFCASFVRVCVNSEFRNLGRELQIRLMAQCQDCQLEYFPAKWPFFDRLIRSFLPGRALR